MSTDPLLLEAAAAAAKQCLALLAKFDNASKFDGNTAAIDPKDDGAIAPDKQALLPRQTATFANYTSYSKGINGIMIDLRGLPATSTLTAADFQIQLGNRNGWPLGPSPQIVVRRGAGIV